MTADPAADYRQGRPLDCTAPSFSSHHEVAWRQPRREARALWGVSSPSATRSQHVVIRPELDTGRDREGTLRREAGNGRDAPRAVARRGCRRGASSAKALMI